MADLRIEQLPTALTLALADLVPLAAYDEQVETGYKASKITAAEIAAALLTTFEQSGLTTTSKTIVGAINEIASGGAGAAHVIAGSSDPTSAQGNDLDLYVKYETSGGETSVTGLFVKLSGAWVSIATGGSSAFIIEVTQSGQTYSIDKTATEIDAAYSDGATMFAKLVYSSISYLCELSITESGTGYVRYSFQNTWNKGFIQILIITHSGTVEVSVTNESIPSINDNFVSSSYLWSSKKTKSYTDEAIVDILPTDTASGAVANFTTSLSLPLVECKAQIVPIQEGTGDPSPTNIRPITGFSSATISQSGADTSNPDTTVLSFEDENGDPITVYGGSLDVKSGEGLNNYIFVDLNAISWTKNVTQTNQNGTYYTAEGDFSALANFTSIMSNVGTAGTGQIPTSPNNSFWVNGQRTGMRWIFGEPYGGSSLSDLEAFLQNNACYLIAERVTPQAVYADPLTLNTLKGVNNVWADTGDIEVEFKVSIKDYIDSQLASLGTRSVSLTKAESAEAEKITETEEEGGNDER